MLQSQLLGTSFTRRALLGGTLAGAGALALAACSGPSGVKSGLQTVKFWDTVWGADSYVAAARKLTNGYSSAKYKGAYQSVPWASYYQTFSSAVASKTGPDVSSGAGFQAFQFYEQGAIHPADNLVKRLKADGRYEDFDTGLFDYMKYDGHYVGVPWLVDIRVLWYRKSLLEKVGAEVPTDWDSLHAAGLKLKREGIYGFGLAGGTSSIAFQAFLSMLINNGGGWFDKDANVDCVTDRNLETVEFLLKLAKDGIINPAAVSYSDDNNVSDWTSSRNGIGFYGQSLAQSFPSADRADVLVGEPLVSPNGTKGTGRFINSLMMYNESPSNEASEDFLSWYLDHMSTYWTQGLLSDLPARRSIVNSAAFQADANAVKCATEWSPIGGTAGGTYASLATSARPALAAVDGGKPLFTWAQQIISNHGSAKQIMETLQSGLEKIYKK